MKVRYRPLPNERILTKVFDALSNCLSLMEEYCNQLASEISSHQFDEAIYTAQQTVGALRVGSKACRRITAGLQELNETSSAFVALNYRMHKIRIIVIALLKCIGAGTAELRIRQLVDNLHFSIDDDLQ
jgi:hypothetical protein